jgi:hypothetical protein
MTDKVLTNEGDRGSKATGQQIRIGDKELDTTKDLWPFYSRPFNCTSNKLQMNTGMKKKRKKARKRTRSSYNSTYHTSQSPTKAVMHDFNTLSRSGKM